ncbi:hypothetical protein [Rhizobium sp. X9]|uniref:hypothetical protein n=1 Tax=Rhizobium sp. X9 TaxID=2815360 RepID=UPI001C0E01B2|nr:hypothetical protein [Rhizobium sp. X9]
MNYATFLKAVAADEAKIAAGITPFGMTACEECKTPLQEAITGNRELSDGTHVCSDCYFEKMSEHLDNHPIRALRVSRGR